MSKLKIDLDVLSDTKNVYDTEIERFKDAKKSIKKALECLKASGWDTNAGRKWFGDVDEGWIKAFEFHIDVIQELSDELKFAQTKYNEVLEELESLKNSLN